MTTEQAELTEAMEVLQRDAGIPHLPTPLTYELRLAVGGNGPRAYDWSDKPHRLVYDACSEVERLTAAARVIADDRAALRKQLAERDGVIARLLNYEGHMVWCGHGKDMDKPCVCGLIDALDDARAILTRHNGGPND